MTLQIKVSNSSTVPALKLGEPCLINSGSKKLAIGTSGQPLILEPVSVVPTSNDRVREVKFSLPSWVSNTVYSLAWNSSNAGFTSVLSVQVLAVWKVNNYGYTVNDTMPLYGSGLSDCRVYWNATSAITDFKLMILTPRVPYANNLSILATLTNALVSLDVLIAGY